MNILAKTAFGLVLVTAACTSSLPSAPTAYPSLPSALPSAAKTENSPQTLVVFAAASLTDAFDEIGAIFEAANPGTTVTFNFAGSQTLRVQLEQGAVADVFASANHAEMDKAVADKLIDVKTPKDFLTNQLVVILPPDNPGKVQSLHDLARPGLKIVLADASVPAGNYARQILNNLGKDPLFGTAFPASVLANVASNETDVKQVVAKIQIGEADAGIVYQSDAVADPNLVKIEIPAGDNVIAQYPLAVLSNSSHRELAQAFVAFVLSPEGQRILQKWGFTPIAP